MSHGSVRASELRRDREWPVADEFPEGRRRLMRASGSYDSVGGLGEGGGIQGSVCTKFTV